MSMLTLNGTVANIYEAPKGVKNGEKRIELVDLSVDDVTPYREAIGKPVRVPVGVYVASGKPAFYALKKQQAAA